MSVELPPVFRSETTVCWGSVADLDFSVPFRGTDVGPRTETVYERDSFPLNYVTDCRSRHLGVQNPSSRLVW